MVRAPLGDRVLDARHHGIAVLRMHVLLEILERAAEAARLDAVDALEPGRPDHPAATEIPFPRAHPAGHHGLFQPLLALAQRVLVSLTRDAERELACDRQAQLQLLCGPDVGRVAIGHELADEPVARHERDEGEGLHALGGHGGPERLVHLGLADVVDSNGRRIAGLGRPRGLPFDGAPIRVRETAPADESHHAAVFEQQDRSAVASQGVEDRVERRLVELFERLPPLQAAGEAVQSLLPPRGSSQRLLGAPSLRQLRHGSRVGPMDRLDRDDGGQARSQERGHAHLLRSAEREPTRRRHEEPIPHRHAEHEHQQRGTHPHPPGHHDRGQEEGRVRQLGRSQEGDQSPACDRGQHHRHERDGIAGPGREGARGRAGGRHVVESSGFSRGADRRTARGRPRRARTRSGAACGRRPLPWRACRCRSAVIRRADPS